MELDEEGCCVEGVCGAGEQGVCGVVVAGADEDAADEKLDCEIVAV